jgi:hypothetical protein
MRPLLERERDCRRAKSHWDVYEAGVLGEQIPGFVDEHVPSTDVRTKDKLYTEIKRHLKESRREE